MLLKIFILDCFIFVIPHKGWMKMNLVALHYLNHIHLFVSIVVVDRTLLDIVHLDHTLHVHHMHYLGTMVNILVVDMKMGGYLALLVQSFAANIVHPLYVAQLLPSYMRVDWHRLAAY